jgi:ketosteroid isomerase-like protein
MASKQLILDMFACVNRKDVEGLSAFLADDYALQVLPSSLGVPPMNKEQFLQAVSRMSTLFPNLTVIHPFHHSALDQRLPLICISSSTNQRKSS